MDVDADRFSSVGQDGLLDICSSWESIDAADDLETLYATKRTRRAFKRISSSECDRVADSGITMHLARAELTVNGPAFLSFISARLQR